MNNATTEQESNTEEYRKYVGFKSDLRQIYFEFGYLVFLFIVTTTILLLLYLDKLNLGSSFEKKYLYSLLGAFLGGWAFDVKWFYRCTALGKNNQYSKYSWESNKFYWRILTPFVCGIVGLVFYIVVISDLIPLIALDKVSSKAAFGFSFIFGYFSDLVLGKFADWASTLTKPKKN